MKVLVAYMSKTGNTKKVAEAIFEEIKDGKDIKPIDAVDSLAGYDIAFLGFPIHRMGPDKKTVQFLEKHCVNGKKVALFITHASQEDFAELPPMLEKFREAARGADIVEMFDCQGELSKTIKRVMSIMPNARLRSWARMDNSQGQPDKSRIDLARSFSRNVMKSVHEPDRTPAAVGR